MNNKKQGSLCRLFFFISDNVLWALASFACALKKLVWYVPKHNNAARTFIFFGCENKPSEPGMTFYTKEIYVLEKNSLIQTLPIDYTAVRTQVFWKQKTLFYCIDVHIVIHCERCDPYVCTFNEIGKLNISKLIV